MSMCKVNECGGVVWVDGGLGDNLALAIGMLPTSSQGVYPFGLSFLQNSLPQTLFKDFTFQGQCELIALRM